MFHETGGLSCAVEQLAIAARKDLFAVLGKCQDAYSLTFTKLHFFDALVGPLLSYACEMWASVAS